MGRCNLAAAEGGEAVLCPVGGKGSGRGEGVERDVKGKGGGRIKEKEGKGLW